MTPEKFFDYLEGKLPPAEKERLERALIADPELQREFVTARQIHRGLQRPPNESSATTRSAQRGRQVAAAFAVLVLMNVALGLIYIFKVNKPSDEVRRAKEDALRHQLQTSVEKSAAAEFPPPSIGIEPIVIPVAREKQNAVAQQIIDAAVRAGGSATKGLPNDSGFSVLVLVPASAEEHFREMLAGFGAPPSAPAATSPAPAPNEPVRLEIRLSAAQPK